MILTRNSCVLTKDKDLEHLFTFEKFPVFMGCTEEEPETDLFRSMSWWVSKSSGVIQLKELVPLEVLYPRSHGAGEVGELWRRHHHSFAKFISSISPKSVFEIGGAHGILEAEHRKFGAIPWTILEPNPHPVTETRATFIRGFFDENYKFSGKFDTLVHSHLFEHVYDPVSFMKTLKEFMPVGTNLLFSVPNMAEMLRRNYTNCLNFEHTYLLTEPYIEYLLANNGFEIERVQYFEEDHSIFVHAIRKSDVKTKFLPTTLHEENSRIYQQYIEYHKNLVSRINLEIDKIETPLYVFGAHVFTQYLIAFGLNTSRIEAILDNDQFKQEKRLYGTTLSVKSPAILKDNDLVTVILRAGVYNDEIRNQIIKTYNKKCRFLE